MDKHTSPMEHLGDECLELNFVFLERSAHLGHLYLLASLTLLLASCRTGVLTYYIILTNYVRMYFHMFISILVYLLTLLPSRYLHS